jgi:hypothetical protein
MVEVMLVRPADHSGANPGLGACPQVHVHHIFRDVFGNGIAVRVYGEMKVAAGERIWARELGLKTLQVLVLTPELNLNNGLGYMAQKYIRHKGEFNNYASIDVYDDASVWQGPGTGPVDGSIWLDFVGLGE